MKNENQLRKSYEKQKQLFEAAKTKKLSNIESKKRDLQTKIDSLQKELSQLNSAEERTLERNFRSFQDFCSEAEKKANSAIS